MLRAVGDFFRSSDFLPHGHCFLWEPGVLWLHVISDAGIAAAYYAIPIVLIYFIHKRKDMPFQAIFLLFGAFILLCGTTHLMSIWVIWHPDYALEGTIKAMTALVSIATFFIMITLIPKALSLPSTAQLAVLNSQLQRANQELEVLYKRSTESGESRLRAVVDNVIDGIITINEQGQIESFNKACETIFGYRANEVQGKNLNILMPEPYHSGHDDYLKHYLETGEAKIIGTAGREVRAKRKDGSIFPIDLSVSVFTLDGKRHFSGIVRDITSRKESEANLLKYMRDLERSNKELDDFAYIASHDLKEPLRGLYNNARFLQQDYQSKLDAEGAKRLQRLEYLSHRMERLVNDLLYFSRLGRQELAVKPTDINLVIKDIESMLDSETLHHLKLVIAKPLPTITCDTLRITELFRNLIANAIKYNDKDPKVIEVGYRESVESTKGTEYGVFFVKDNGIGIDSEFFDEIFGMFKRLNEEDDTKKGTGVGLTFVRKIVERHGGRIWLESKPGEGSTFYFTIAQRG